MWDHFLLRLHDIYARPWTISTAYLTYHKVLVTAALLAKGPGLNLDSTEGRTGFSFLCRCKEMLKE